MQCFYDLVMVTPTLSAFSQKHTSQREAYSSAWISLEENAKYPVVGCHYQEVEMVLLDLSGSITTSKVNISDS